MQLLCENDNRDFKLLMRKQMSPNGKKKHNSINFIKMSNKILRTFLKIFNFDIIDIPMNLMDFVIDISQVPVLENQVVIANSTFIEDVCALNH